MYITIQLVHIVYPTMAWNKRYTSPWIFVTPSLMADIYLLSHRGEVRCLPPKKTHVYVFTCKYFYEGKDIQIACKSNRTITTSVLFHMWSGRNKWLEIFPHENLEIAHKLPLGSEIIFGKPSNQLCKLITTHRKLFSVLINQVQCNSLSLILYF